MFYLNVRDDNHVVQAYDITDAGLRMLHFTRHYTDILQEILTSLTCFVANLLRYYMCVKKY